MVDPRIRLLCVQHLTPAQIEVWARHHEHGWSFRRIATHLDLARSSVMDRYDGANRKLRAHGVKFTPDGNPYLEDIA